jgi:hypothetical protein
VSIIELIATTFGASGGNVPRVRDDGDRARFATAIIDPTRSERCDEDEPPSRRPFD